MTSSPSTARKVVVFNMMTLDGFFGGPNSGRHEEPQAQDRLFQDLIIFGIDNLAASLAKLGLIDEYRIIGRRPIFTDTISL